MGRISSEADSEQGPCRIPHLIYCDLALTECILDV